MLTPPWITSSSHPMDALAHDLRYAVRTLLHMRGVAVIAIVTLAVGIGATTTMFSVVYAMLLRQPPLPGPERLVILFNTSASAREGLRQWRWALSNIGGPGRLASSFHRSGSFR